jgi:broad specificity phosphatase PhoE
VRAVGRGEPRSVDVAAGVAHTGVVGCGIVRWGVEVLPYMNTSLPSSTARIHFVRHAETLFNVNGQVQGWCDAPLTARGERQAEALGEWMRAVPLAAAFTSDLTRTRTTTEAALVSHPSVAPTPMRELREWNFGGFEGQSNSSLWEPVFARHGFEYAPASADWVAMTANGLDGVIDAIHDVDPLGRAESAADVRDRLAAGLEVVIAAAKQAAANGAGDVLVVTHGAVLGSILQHLLPGASMRGGFPNCGIATVTIEGDTITVGEVDASCSASIAEADPTATVVAAAP